MVRPYTVRSLSEPSMKYEYRTAVYRYFMYTINISNIIISTE